MKTLRLLALLSIIFIGFSASAELKAGDKAPSFSLVADSGKLVSLSDFAGKDLAVFFYKEDFCPNCVKKGLGLTAKLADFAKKNVSVICISVDDTKSHKSFKAKYNLAQTLLTDTDGKVSKSYGVFREETQRAKHITFLIDGKGFIKRVLTTKNYKNHANEVLSNL
jgi:thioredoxin-dependent peroxiredoxin